MITDNSKGAGDVQEYIQVIPDSWRMMSVPSPRTSNLHSGVFFEVRVAPDAVQVWKASKDGYERAEEYQAAAYLRMRELEKTRNLFLVREGVGLALDPNTGQTRNVSVTVKGAGDGVRQTLPVGD